MTDDLTIKGDFTLRPRPVGDLNFTLGERVVKYAPENVKPEDLPYLLHLFAALLLPSFGLLDVTGFVDEHKLWHCFKGQ